ncbi:MAG: HNH endonuclease [Desulfobacterales bacterium]|nr:HNH endonuclease [Desulfobacterales bacterium]
MEHNYKFFADDEDIKKEKNKARLLKKSEWWKRKCSKGVCHYCGQQIPPQELTMDHIVPLSRGGQSKKGNIVPACKNCNNLKKHNLLMEWENIKFSI